MKSTVLFVAVFLALFGTAQAAVMSYSDNGEGTITQTYDSGAFQPGVPSTINILFDQFNTQGGTRTLQSVTVSVTQYAWGGYYSVDNDGDTVANITVQHGATGNITTTAGYEYFLPAGSLDSLSTILTSNGTVTLQPNDGDATDVYNDGGTDAYRLDGPTQGNALSENASGTRTTGLDAYTGLGDLSLTYTVNQSSDHDGEGALYYSGGPSSVQSLITVTYNYNVVPEPTSLALLAFGCAALGLRRRKGFFPKG